MTGADLDRVQDTVRFVSLLMVCIPVGIYVCYWRWLGAPEPPPGNGRAHWWNVAYLAGMILLLAQ